MKTIQTITKIIFISILLKLTKQATLRELTAELGKACLSVSDFNTQYETELENRTLKKLFTPPKKKATPESEQNIPIKLGNGAHGISYGYFWNSKPIAIKVIKKQKTIENLKNFLDELSITKKLSSASSAPNYINCAYEEQKENLTNYTTIYLFQEYLRHNLDNADLQKWLHSATIAQKGQFYKSLYASLQPIHALKITHNDIKPDNIMIGQNSNPETKLFSPIKLIDFGLSESFGEPTFLSTKCYDMYKSPESTFSAAYDVYAMTVTIVELESNFNIVCREFINNDCYGKKDMTCLGYMKKSVLGVVAPIFGTKAPKGGVYNIGECMDYGCVLLSCLKMTKAHMPKLSVILGKFDEIASGVYDENKMII